MQDTISNEEFANLDLTDVAALQQKRTLAFVNHFVVTNVQFLNTFMKQCEQKLMQFERKLEKVNAAIVLLETRLSSIPELSIPASSTNAENKEEKTTDETDIPIENITSTEAENTSQVDKVEENTKQSRPEYDRFVKMVQVGVPVQAVKLKVSLEGLDPNVLDEILK